MLISNDPKDIDVLLFTRQNVAEPQQLVATDTIDQEFNLDQKLNFDLKFNLSKKLNFNPEKVTKIIVHGFGAGMFFAQKFINGEWKTF